MCIIIFEGSYSYRAPARAPHLQKRLTHILDALRLQGRVSYRRSPPSTLGDPHWSDLMIADCTIIGGEASCYFDIRDFILF